MTGFFRQYGGSIVTLTMEHLWLTGAAMLFAVAIAVPAGIWLTRSQRLARPVMAFANVLQTIPSLAMFGFLMPLPWLGDRAARIAIVALIAYALLPILRNTYAGIRGIDQSVIEVSRAIGADRYATAYQGRAAAGGAIYSCRLENRHGHVHWSCNDCRGGWGRRTGRVDLSRSSVGR